MLNAPAPSCAVTPRPLEGPLIWSAVNFSEGRRARVIQRILEGLSGDPGSVLADWSADRDHNRMVATLLGSISSVAHSIAAGCAIAIEEIDLREHAGAHPRAGAVDVIPLVPVRDISMDRCIAASLELGRQLAKLHRLPVFLYERSARPGRRALLPELRRGGFEGLFEEPLLGDRAPDFGPPEPHPSAGMVVIGARSPLAAFNVNLESEDASAARRIAANIRRLRDTTPSLTGVRALGLSLPSRRQSQVSMNLTMPAAAPIPGVFAYVRFEAEQAGVNVAESEVIGLVSREFLGGAEPRDILWNEYHSRQILENWM